MYHCKIHYTYSYKCLNQLNWPLYNIGENVKRCNIFNSEHAIRLKELNPIPSQQSMCCCSYTGDKINDYSPSYFLTTEFVTNLD